MFFNVFLSNNRPFSFFIIKIMFATIKLMKPTNEQISDKEQQTIFMRKTEIWFFAVPKKKKKVFWLRNNFPIIHICFHSSRMSSEFVHFLNAICSCYRKHFISASTLTPSKSRIIKKKNNNNSVFCIGQVLSKITGFRFCLHKILFWFLSFID